MSVEYQGDVDVLANVITSADLLSRKELISSPRARYYLERLLDHMSKLLAMEQIDIDTYQKALAGLDVLTPKLDSSGQVSIGGIRVSEGLRALIESRLSATEVSVFGPEGALGRLPSEVRKYICATGFAVEFTDRCTVKCSFCDLARKGKIREIILLEDALQLMRIRALSSSQADFIPYGGTDPFDAKWSRSGEEVWFGDLLRHYYNSAKELSSAASAPRVSLSTAIPIGEEFAVLDGLVEAIYTRNFRDIPRISPTMFNKQRAEAMNNILSAIFNRRIDLTYGMNLRDEDALLSGDQWRNIQHGEFRMEDVIGVRCYDGVIISPGSIDGVLVMPQSPEHPNGSLRRPIESIAMIDPLSPSSTLFRYDVPIYQDISVKAATAMNPRLTSFFYSGSTLVSQKETEVSDPHRSAFRLAALLADHETGVADKKINGIKRFLNGIFLRNKHILPLPLRDLQVLKEYLQQGNPNPVYEYIVRRMDDILK
ncbi:MAG TPA: hypothetical protein PKG71_02545 [Candidatus Woesebacteria bacterium]|nr:hypothetical protein [Candidatus Woesebacteria bacterium]HNS94824.1 hypothetical protein [Candidatus Woesebacteria bacterium]